MSPLVLVKAADGVLGSVPVNEATSCDAVLFKVDPTFPEARTLGEFGVMSTRVFVLDARDFVAGGGPHEIRRRWTSPKVEELSTESASRKIR